MSERSKNSKRESASGKAHRSFTKATLALPLFILGGSGAVFIALLYCLLAFYSQERFVDKFLIYLAPALLFVPSFVLALMRWRGASIPLWLVTLWSLIPTPLHQPGPGISAPHPGFGILFIPVLVELARYFRPAKLRPR